ncbi:MAG: hypothetical protein P8178_19110 [Candidatus Thiodiazotropha sp.]
MRRTEAHPSLQLCLGQRRQRLVVERQQATRIAEQQFAPFGEGDAAGVAFQQWGIQTILQPLELLADSGLGPVQPFGGAGKATAIHHSDEGAQEFQFEVSGQHIMKMDKWYLNDSFHK